MVSIKLEETVMKSIICNQFYYYYYLPRRYQS